MKRFIKVNKKEAILYEDIIEYEMLEEDKKYFVRIYTKRRDNYHYDTDYFTSMEEVNKWLKENELQ